VDSTRDLDGDLAALFAEEHVAAGDGVHPEPDELLEYLDGQLGQEAAGRIRDHLEGCRDCTAVLLDLEILSRPDEPRTDGAVDFELAAAQRAFQERLGVSERAAPRPSRLWQAAAAVFFAATLGLAWQVARLQGDLDARDAPRFNVPVLYLEPTRTEEALDARLGPDQGAESFLVFLMLTDPGAFSEYEVEILGPGDTLVRTGRGLEPGDSGALNITLSRRFLTADEVRLRLFGVTGGSRELIDDYRIEVKERGRKQ